MKKITIAIAFFCICFSFDFACSNRANLITVDDEGDGDFTSIIEAVNYLQPGDTIEVYSGTYYEYYIWINVSNVIIRGVDFELGNGNDTGKPRIYGEDKERIFLTSNVNNITINNFFFDNRGPDGVNMILGLYDSENITISDSIFFNCTHGIKIYESNYCIINNNTIAHTSNRAGIHVHYASNIVITNNKIFDIPNFRGINLWDADHCIIENNIISECGESCIEVSSCVGTEIRHNQLTDSEYGIRMYLSYNTIVENNYFDNNHLHARFQQGRYIPGNNRWDGNYWARGRIIPVAIPGYILQFIPWINIDWYPAMEPYQIS